jgi:hypothetical protein
VGRRGRGWGKGGEMTQTLYAHMNKKIKIKKNSKRRADSTRVLLTGK